MSYWNVSVRGIDKLVQLYEKSKRLVMKLEGTGFSERLADEILDACIREAPEVTGNLKRQHEIRWVRPHNIRIANNAKYAKPVHDGFVHWRSGKFVKGNPWMVRAIVSPELKQATDHLLRYAFTHFDLPPKKGTAVS